MGPGTSTNDEQGESDPERRGGPRFVMCGVGGSEMGPGKMAVWANDLCASGGQGFGRGWDAPAQSRAGPHVAGTGEN